MEHLDEYSIKWLIDFIGVAAHVNLDERQREEIDRLIRRLSGRAELKDFIDAATEEMRQDERQRSTFGPIVDGLRAYMAKGQSGTSGALYSDMFAEVSADFPASGDGAKRPHFSRKSWRGMWLFAAGMLAQPLILGIAVPYIEKDASSIVLTVLASLVCVVLTGLGGYANGVANARRQPH